MIRNIGEDWKEVGDNRKKEELRNEEQWKQ